MSESLRFTDYNQFLTALYHKKHPFFAAAHRGMWGKAPENSLVAFANCIKHHVYLIEMDLQQTKDGHLVIMHDDTVDRTTDGTGKIADMTLTEARHLRLKEGAGGKHAALTECRIPTIFEALSLVKGKAMINADKSWDDRHELYEALEVMDAFDHVLLKSRQPVDEVLDFFQSREKAIHYMHIISDDNLDQLDELFERFSPVAIEILFHKDSDLVLSEPVLSKMRSRANLWVNSLDDGENAGHNDALSLIDPERGWGWHLDRGINMIQTDYPEKALAYAQHRFAGKS
ncbi:glycerophosphodiester phosphodiesterase family protein [Planococcus sp. APC 3906]|uniref:glycerophosphodiester phosphodiesterase family protein n=1 Tax=Planococcus sp. APC 3906 TaxID=3035194 RepID=UPI0025B512D2|nr:glycerophosphodiester phosphodiesterase family protein [Planococcus sp. APC 3906]MDN3448981.1 glycerophosphodiester phosphodiesterase family protein [Planococcus sp. APC 3906]